MLRKVLVHEKPLSGTLMGMVGAHNPTFCPQVPAGCEQCLTLDAFIERTKDLTYEGLLFFVFSCPSSDYPDTRPFHKWVRTDYVQIAGKAPAGPGSAIERYYMNALREYGWRIATGLVIVP